MADRACDPLPIGKRAVLAVEGDDEFYFFLALCRREGVRDELFIHNLGGRDGLPGKLATLAVSPGFDISVGTLGIVIDAESDPVASVLQSVGGAVQRGLDTIGRSTPPTFELKHGRFVDLHTQPTRAGAFIMPDGVSPGMLEDLCLRGVAGNPVLESCVSAYVQCLAREGVANADSGKRRLHAFLASCHDPGLRLGQAANAGCWNLEHECWDPLKQFLRDLASAE